MTEELKRLIEESIEDEKTDVIKYHKMSVMAESECCSHLSGMLEDLSHEENTHKFLLEKLLNE